MTTKSSCFEEIDDISAIEEPEVNNNKIKKTNEIESESEDSKSTSDDEITESKINHNTFYDVWTYHKQDNINNLKILSNIWLAGDGQYDSPGFCAKYCIYSVMDLNSSKIVDFQLVQKGMVKGDLERAACEMLLQKLIVEYD
ncbi:hypothetical protein QTP88_010859 [Uroleucon formosanum]